MSSNSDVLAAMVRDERINVFLLEPIFPHTDECRICGCEVVLRTFGPNYGIAMYEDLPVPPEWEGEWGGFTACKDCYEKNERGDLLMWTVEQLSLVTANAVALQHRGDSQEVDHG